MSVFDEFHQSVLLVRDGHIHARGRKEDELLDSFMVRLEKVSSYIRAEGVAYQIELIQAQHIGKIFDLRNEESNASIDADKWGE